MSDESQIKNSKQKSQEQLKEPGKKVQKRLPINGLLYTLCFSLIGFVGLNFATCNFAIPGTLQQRWTTGELKNEPKIDCAKTQNDGIMQLLGAAGLLIAYKAKSED